MKKRILLSSIVTIALCLSLIAGSTFALFTDWDDIDISVEAGKVSITAGLTEPVLYSVQPDAAGAEFDENGKPYSYVQQPGNTFANGGTATLQADGTIKLERVTPGDKITFNLTGLNDSNVAVQYRYKLECVGGYDLMSGFVTTVEGTKYASMAAYTSEWNPLGTNVQIDKDANDGLNGIPLAIELPVSAGNEFQELDATLKLTVEVVQNNADTSDTDAVTVKYITTVKDETELAAKLKADEILHIFVRNDINGKVVITEDLTDKTIDANDHNINIEFNGNAVAPIKLENVSITNVKDTPDETPAVTITNNVSGDITITESEFYNGSKTPYGCIAANGSAPNLDVTVEKCKMYSGVGATDVAGAPVYGEKYGIYMTNANSLTVRDTEFFGFGSWAIMVNGTTTGNIVISGCTFNDCAGIFKTSVTGGKEWQTGSLNGNFTFANNKMYNCTMKDNTFMQIKELYGSITFSNNTHNDVVITVEDMKCEYLTNKYKEQQ